jgi:hypothetical protein
MENTTVFMSASSQHCEVTDDDTFLGLRSCNIDVVGMRGIEP